MMIKNWTILGVSMVMSVMNALQAGVLDVKIKDIKGNETSLGAYRGKVILVVNTASKCGLTKQYAGLEALYLAHQKDGLVVAGFPCNQFGGQEPGAEADILTFCTQVYSVTFPLFAKLDVNGPIRHPLYQALAGPESPFPGDIGWNFTKFLIGRDGTILARFDSRVAPDAPELVKAVKDALATQAQ